MSESTRRPTAPSSTASRLLPAKHVFLAVHGTQTVLLDSRRGHYYGLDEVGGRIWSMLKQGHEPAAIVTQLSEEYQAEPTALASDVARLLANLKSQRLLEAC